MARIKESNFGETPFQRLLGYNVEVMQGWAHLGNVLEKEGRLSPELKEQVRRTLAQSNGCEYCKAKGKPELDKFDEKTSISVAFTEVFLKQKGDIPTSVFKVLQECLTEEEISELCAFISFTTASQYFGEMMKLEPVRK
ncbi:carboxymuconolactone decarboxylase family protein [Alkalihalophilus lindianensis]|uniref:Carboxymuconolactone decarboxylase family protein n=1 Tax=Alkalihalophilus lindianensis TaxID=1630542 RepID=A0ABU3XG28_9BACI|nr:carboxymuconolactone decarboxylase family protein [Alkalihalophilus lindianensis]MDV2686825.1 carboxymuconolactone decarboxylase family protein [Alkalihalophilus lindianensis]